jgi:uncharacterized protein
MTPDTANRYQGKTAAFTQWLSRRRMLSAAASILPVIGSVGGLIKAQQGPPAGAQGGPPRMPRITPGGTGPIKVLLITGGHPYDRESFYLMLDSFGKEITWTHVDYPAAEALFDPAAAAPFDVFLFYDIAGRQSKYGTGGPPQVTDQEPSQKMREGMKALLQKGKGMVFFHHAVGAWVLWPEYHEIRGAAAQFTSLPGLPWKARGKDFPFSPNKIGVQQHITIADKEHPVVQGLGEGFDITDEVFIHPVFEDSVHPLLRTDFKRVDSNFTRQYAQGWRHPEGSNLAAWCKASERSPVVYLQFGHDATAWDNPAFRTLMMNSIRWAGSKEALAWAAANKTTIFK